jgi:hypothetical protein
MPHATPRRLVILAEGEFGYHHAKTAMGVLRYGRDPVVAVIDSTRVGRNVAEWLPGCDVPIVASLAQALAMPEPPTALLIVIAPTGGRRRRGYRAQPSPQVHRDNSIRRDGNDGRGTRDGARARDPKSSRSELFTERHS